MPTLSNEELKKEVLEIADYLGCNGGELWSEISKLFATQNTALLKEVADTVIGADMPLDMSFNRTEDQIIRDTCYTQGVNETKAEQRSKLAAMGGTIE